MTAEHKRSEPIVTSAMRAVLDAVSDGVVVLDRDRRVVFMNRAARELLGYAEASPVGARCSDVLDTEDCEHNCPLTRLESRPTKAGLGDYCFVIDCEGHVADELVADALRNLHAKHGGVKFLGSYPAAASDDAGRARRRAAGQAWRDASRWVEDLRGRIA